MINIFNDEAFMKKYYPLLTVILLGLPLCSQALTLNLRGGYRSASHAYETLIQVSQGGIMVGGQVLSQTHGIQFTTMKMNCLHSIIIK